MPRSKIKKAPRKIAPGIDPITLELHSAIADHIAQPGRTLYGLATEAGLDESSLRRFVSRERTSLALPSVGKLCFVLGLKLVRRRTKVVSGQWSVVSEGGTQADAPVSPDHRQLAADNFSGDEG